MSLKDLKVGVTDLLKIPLDKVRVAIGNPRTDFSHVPDLAVSISDRGQLEPVSVRLSECGNFAEITHGECRYRAILYANEKLGANIQSITCSADSKGIDKQEVIIRHCIKNNSGKPLSALDQANAYHELHIDFGMSAGEIAKAVNKSFAHVQDHLCLFYSPASVLEKVKTGEISASAAIEIAKAPEKKQEKIVNKIKERDQVEVSGKGVEKKRVTVADVQKEVKGHADVVSAKDINRYIKIAKDNMYAAKQGSKEQIRWEGVKFGLEVALGMHEID